MRTLQEVKEIFGEKVHESARTFVVNDHGKYRPNISFVLPKNFSGNPLKFRGDAPTQHMVAGLGLSLGSVEAKATVLFGNFWESKRGKPHFSPKPVSDATHFLLCVGWGGGFGRSRTRGARTVPKGALYFRRASSNGGGTGKDYYVLPVGYQNLVHDEGLDGDIVAEPDFVARAKQIRAAFAQHDQAQADNAKAKDKAKAEADAASREAKVAFMPRLEAIQSRLEVLRLANPGYVYSKMELGETCFVFGWGERLYTEENVLHVEYNVEQHEEKSAKRDERAVMTPSFETFASRVEALGLALRFSDESVNWEGGSYYDDFPYTQEGLKGFEADLSRKEEEAAEKAREETTANAKTLAEAEAGELGLPQDIRIWKRTGGATGCSMGWVINADGLDRERDELENSNPRRAARYDEGFLVWKQILPEEVVLRWSKANTAAEHQFEVVHLPADGLTESQAERVMEVQMELQDTWAGRSGLSSRKPSPSVGNGWGFGEFETPMPAPKVVHSTGEQPVVPPNSADEPQPLDIEEGLAALADKFGPRR